MKKALMFLVIICTLNVYFIFQVNADGGCVGAPCDCRSGGGSFHPTESKWCNSQLCINQCMSEGRAAEKAEKKAEMPPDFGGIWRTKGGNSPYRYYFRVSGHQISLFQFEQWQGRKCTFLNWDGTLDGRHFEGRCTEGSQFYSSESTNCSGTDMDGIACDVTGEISEDGSQVEIKQSNKRLSPRMKESTLNYAKRMGFDSTPSSYVLIRE